jgi:hypothetical protein
MASGDMPQEAYRGSRPCFPWLDFATSTSWFHHVSFVCSFSEWLIQISTNLVNEVFDWKAADREFIPMVVTVYPVPVLLLVKDLAFP